MKKLKFIVLGMGARGWRYTENAYKSGHDFELVAFAEPNPVMRERAGEKFGVPEDMRFQSWEEVLALGKIADFAVITTQDRMHFEPSMQAIELGYHLLLEKPIAPTPEECAAICKAAEKKGVEVMVCHVYRFGPFTRKVKEIIDSGLIGKVTAVIHEECVAPIHYATAYVRGPWRNSETSSNMLLAKCCHDIDLLQWLVGAKCKKVQSFGSLSHFRKENCPEGAPKYCVDGCPRGQVCPYSAVKQAQEGSWIALSPDGKRVSDEELARRLRGGRGVCVYQNDNNVVDHQSVNMEFCNGATATFTVSTFGTAGRRLHIIGTKGDIISTDLENLDLYLSCVEDPESPRYGKAHKEHIHVCEINQHAPGHSGGDEGIIEDLWKLLAEEETTPSVASIRTSTENHMMVFAAEYSRENGNQVVDMEKFSRQYL